jgi:hypothetical protein
MSCLLEIQYYLLKQVIQDRLTQEQSFKNFKELLLRHSVQRPPHSLAIFNLDDVKQINECMQEGFYRFYNWYLYTLTKKDMLVLTTEKIFTLEQPHLERLEAGKVIPAREIEDLK